MYQFPCNLMDRPQADVSAICSTTSQLSKKFNAWTHIGTGFSWMFDTCTCFITICAKEFKIESRRIQSRTIDSSRSTLRCTQKTRYFSRSTQLVCDQTIYTARACLLMFSCKCNHSWFNTIKHKSIRLHGTIFPKTYQARERSRGSHINWSIIRLLAAVNQLPETCKWELVLKHRVKSQEAITREKYSCTYYMTNLCRTLQKDVLPHAFSARMTAQPNET
jgi:hypothetical protein